MSVKSVEVIELRDLDRDELWTQLDNARRELVSLRFQQATGQIDDHSKMGRARRRVARIMTIIREAELEEDGLLDHRSVQVRWYESAGMAEGSKTSIGNDADTDDDTVGAEEMRDDNSGSEGTSDESAVADPTSGEIADDSLSDNADAEDSADVSETDEDSADETAETEDDAVEGNVVTESVDDEEGA